MKQISLRGPLTWRGSHCAHSMPVDSVMRMGSYFCGVTGVGLRQINFQSVKSIDANAKDSHLLYNS